MSIFDYDYDHDHDHESSATQSPIRRSPPAILRGRRILNDAHTGNERERMRSRKKLARKKCLSFSPMFAMESRDVERQLKNGEHMMRVSARRMIAKELMNKGRSERHAIEEQDAGRSFVRLRSCARCRKAPRVEMIRREVVRHANALRARRNDALKQRERAAAKPNGGRRRRAGFP